MMALQPKRNEKKHLTLLYAYVRFLNYLHMLMEFMSIQN